MRKLSGPQNIFFFFCFTDIEAVDSLELNYMIFLTYNILAIHNCACFLFVISEFSLSEVYACNLNAVCGCAVNATGADTSLPTLELAN